MAQHITLPSGATADIRDAVDVTERQRRPIRRIQTRLAGMPAFAAAIREAEAAQAAAGNDAEIPADVQLKVAAGMGEAFDLLEELNDALVAAVVRGWSYEFPVTVDAVQDVPGRDLDALRTACAPLLRELMPNFEPTPDADSPTAPSIA
jgi:hypothetical protein